MQYRQIGNTGLKVSPLAFGAGPIPQLMTTEDSSQQFNVLRYALDCGINWIDTAATYGQGQSESSIGKSIRALQKDVQIATKVRIMPEQVDDIASCVRSSVEGSLKRLQRNELTLLQLHNSITPGRGDLPTSLTPDDVLHQVLPAMDDLKKAGTVQHLGLTGIGEPSAMRQVIRSRAFQTVQIPFNLLNPTAGFEFDDTYNEFNYGHVIQDCFEMNMAVFPIRVFAGGAVMNAEPSPHTFKTPFFPLDLYQRDCAKSIELAETLGIELPSLRNVALRFAIFHPQCTAPIIGFSRCEHIDDALEALHHGPLSDDELAVILAA